MFRVKHFETDLACLVKIQISYQMFHVKHLVAL